MYSYDLIALGIACVGGIIWAVRLEGRIDGHDTVFVERDKQLLERHEELKDRLVRIEQKLDRQNGYALRDPH